MPSSSVAVRPHPFEHSGVFALLGRVWPAAVLTFASGSRSTILRTAFPSRTRWILSASQVRALAFGFASLDDEGVAKACQKTVPSCWRSICEAIAASMASCAVGESFEEVNVGVMGPSFGDEGGDGWVEACLPLSREDIEDDEARGDVKQWGRRPAAKPVIGGGC